MEVNVLIDGAQTKNESLTLPVTHIIYIYMNIDFSLE